MSTNNTEKQEEKIPYDVSKELFMHRGTVGAQVAASPQDEGKLSVLTFNIWFSKYNLEERVEAVASQVIATHLPDVVCLQEVTMKAYHILTRHTVIQNNYMCCWYDPDNPRTWVCIAQYGCAIFVRNTRKVSKLHIKKLPTSMGRKLHCVEIQLGQDVFCIGTVHLESLSSAALRKQQLEIISNHLSTYSHAILCGDFNFDSKRNYIAKSLPLENDCLKQYFSGYDDVWTLLHPSQAGYTFDTAKNANLARHRPERMRYDRIMLRSGIYKAQSICLTGDKVIGDGKLKEVMPSDHFGLLCVVSKS